MLKNKNAIRLRIRRAWLPVWVVLCLPLTAIADDAFAPELAEQVSSADAAIRRQAALELFDLGPHAKTALPAVVELLRDSEPSIRLLAVATLARIGPAAAAAAPELAARLDDPDEGVRTAAIEALQWLGPAAEPALVEIAENGTWQARVSAGQFLEANADQIDLPIPVLVADLPKHAWSLHAPEFDDGTLPFSVADLLRQLTSTGSESVRYRALSSLGRYGPEAQDATPILADILRHSGSAPGVRILTAWTLGQIGPAAEPASAELLAALNRDPYFAVRAHAAQALGKIGAASPAVIAALTRGLAEPQGNLRGACAIALWRIGPKASSTVVDPLRRILADPGTDPLERYFVTGALSALGREASPAVTEIVRLLDDEQADVRFIAAYAFGRIGVLDPTGIEALRRLAADSDEKQNVRAAANSALTRLARRQRLTVD